MEGDQEFFIHRLHRLAQMGLGGRRTEDGRRRTEDRGMGERIDSFKELRVYKEAWALNLEVLLLAIICVNLCNLWITRPLLSRIRVIRVIRGHTLCSSGFLLNVSFLFCEEFGG